MVTHTEFRTNALADRLATWVFFKTISEQMTAADRSRYAVMATAAARIDPPLLLVLHWHGSGRATPLRIRGVEIPARTVQGSVIQLNERGGFRDRRPDVA